MERKQRISSQTAAVLFALAEQGSSWSHGYDLCGRLGLKAGTIYPILMRLADREQVDAEWETVAANGRPPRHLYRLSASGAELVQRLRAEQFTGEGGPTRQVVRGLGPAIGTADA
ncbi:MAG TPA: PadR family transcriptional regulator [Microlunatus sp.]